MEDKTSQYCDDICKGLAEFFMCRNFECLFVTNSSQWVRRSWGEKLRCPMCNQEYLPWAGASTKIPCQKLLILSKGNNHKMYPIEWSDSTQTLLKNQIKEIFMDLKTELKGCNGHEQIRTFFEEKARTSMRPYFQSYTYGQQGHIDWLNAQPGKNQSDPWTYKHIEGEGVLKGFHFKYEEGTPILDYKETARIYGMFLVSVELGRKLSTE